ncbi:MAG: hypothetical protein IKE18_07400 [Oscillospiraceae bacterium]|nr:hypothetical protein [Oscillospiraceae bacterium]
MKTDNKRLLIMIISFALIAALAVGTSIAYFTTYTAAKGSQTIHLGYTTRISEEYDDFAKSLTIHNDEKSGQYVYVRAKAFSDSSVEISYSDYDGKWNPGEDDFYYFADPVAPGGDTSVLKVIMVSVPENPEEGDTFNVVVIYESTAAKYREDGTPYADWNEVLDITEEEIVHE